MMTFLEAAEHILRAANVPLHYEEITQRALAQGIITTKGKTPAATLDAQIAVDIKVNGPGSRFVRVRPGVYALHEWHLPEAQPAAGEEVTPIAPDAERQEPRRVRIPLFPLYSHVRGLLPVLDGRPRSHLQDLLSQLIELRGTPQEPEDWSNPDEWIGQRLQGDEQALASAIWGQSGHKVNPRYIYGIWYLARGYALVAEDAEGTLRLTENGRDFLIHPDGETVAHIDREEGFIKLLAILAGKGTGKRSDLLPEWSAYLQTCSNFSTDSTFKDTLRRRLLNLVERGLVSRSGNIYQITSNGLAYLERVSGEKPSTVAVSSELYQLYQLAEQQRQIVREQLAEQLSKVDPFRFERLIRRLLEEMGYENVEVTSPTNDRGVDVFAEIELGITKVREVVQVKRHVANIQRPVLDALRGSLHRFRAVRGTIITTGDFSKGTKDAALEAGAAPITLINGQKLLDLLIEHSLGVRKKTIEVWELDDQAFATGDEESA